MLSLEGKQTEIADKKSDTKYFALDKFFRLATDCNPNIIELLYLPDDAIIFKNATYDRIIAQREIFMSRKAYYTFTGYAYSQISRAKGQNKKANFLDTYYDENVIKWWLRQYLNDQKEWVQRDMGGDFVKYLEKVKDTLDLSQVTLVSSDAIARLMPPRLENYIYFYDKDENGFPCRPIVATKLQNVKGWPTPFNTSFTSTGDIANVEHCDGMCRLYRNGTGFIKDGQIVCASISKERELKDFIGIININLAEFKKALSEWQSFWEWMANRSEARYATAWDADKAFDCYLDSETEFLTNNGWKQFDEVLPDDLLGTVSLVDQSFAWQSPDNKIDKMYNGKLYKYENSFTKFSITENHNLLISDMNRGTSLKSGYNPNSSFSLERVSDYFKGERSYKKLLITSNGNQTPEYDISDALLKLIGYYVSEGSCAFQRGYSGKVCSIRISQLENGRITEQDITNLNFKFTVTKHFRYGRNENTYIFTDKMLVSFLYNECGHLCQNKKLPLLVNNLSTRQYNILLDALMAGDGTFHKIKHYKVYYTASNILADQILALNVQHGIKSKILGPYFSISKKRVPYLPMYQIYFSSVPEFTLSMNKKMHKPRLFRNDTQQQNGWIVTDVTNERVVCFSVPNSILITKNNNKVAIQGNCKNMMHTVRLLLCSRNIAINGTPTVRFEGEQKTFLMDVRNGKYDYDYIVKYAEDEMLAIKELFHKSALPETANHKKINSLYLDIVFNY